MSVVAAIISHLKHDPAITVRIGTAIFRGVASRNAVLPYIIVQKTRARHTRHMAASAGLVSAGLQMTCWDNAAKDAEALANEVRKSLDHRNHEDIGKQPDVVDMRAAFLEDEIEQVVPAAVGGGDIFGVVMIWTVWYAETVPTF